MLREHPAAVKVSEAGSARRRKETFRDLDIIATATDPEALIDYFTKLKWVIEVVAKGPTKATVLSNEGSAVRPSRRPARVVRKPAAALHGLEGPQRRATRASREGTAFPSPSIRSPWSRPARSSRSRRRQEVYERLGYEFIPPELRENAGELEAARKRTLPKLVELADIKGDLHSHTTWSDGRDTLEQMVLAARARGYAYYAVTDHPRGTLAEQDLEIDALNEKLKPFRILKGIEVNIRVDGSLSLPDEVLAERDWVIASLHGAFDREPTERVLAAMENPHVDMIGHLTARKINIRGPADIDIARVVEKAVETGTFLEINAQPNRLDLRDTHARLAGEAGVKVAVNTDAHQLSALAAHGDGRRAGAPRLADEGASAEYAHVAADPEAPKVSFRDDGAAGARVGCALPRTRRRVSRAGPGRARRHPRTAARFAAGARRSVCRRSARCG